MLNIELFQQKTDEMKQKKLWKEFNNENMTYKLNPIGTKIIYYWEHIKDVSDSERVKKLEISEDMSFFASCKKQKNTEFYKLYVIETDRIHRVYTKKKMFNVLGFKVKEK